MFKPEEPRPALFDAVVVGGGPAGATAATDLARQGHQVLLIDKAGRIKPCGGAIPPRLIRDFDIPDDLLCAHITAARMVSPKDRRVDMPIQTGGYVGMVDREVFDEFLRRRAAENGATRIDGTFETVSREPDGTLVVHYRPANAAETVRVRTRLLLGADGANSAVAREALPEAGKAPFVFAYHEIIRTPEGAADAVDPTRCDIYYRGTLSPDFYAWIFPHGKTMSVGTGTARKGFGLKEAIRDLRAETGLAEAQTLRREGAPIPLKPLRRWDNGRDVLLVGDAAGIVAPASGEGIYYAMLSGRLAAEEGGAALGTGDARRLRLVRKRFMRDHGRIFWVLRMMQTVWYRNDMLREHFVSICRDKDVQALTWDSYMNKRLVRSKPAAHVKIFFKDLAHLFRLVPP
jgi:geranylgeranyl reductase